MSPDAAIRARARDGGRPLLNGAGVVNYGGEGSGKKAPLRQNFQGW